MERTTLFVDVILPVAVPRLYTYRVPYERNSFIKEGQRVVVQFGKNKLYTALVRHIHENPPDNYAAKYIEEIIDEQPIVNTMQFKLWEWIADYYMCTIGEVMNAALPSGLKLSSETKIVLSEKSEIKTQELSDKEYLIIEALEINHELRLDEIHEIIGQKTVQPIIKLLIEKGLIIIQEELKEKYKPKIASYVRLTDYANNEENLKTIFNELEKKSNKQLTLLLSYIKLSGRYEHKQVTDNKAGIKKSELLKHDNGSDSVLKSLVKKNIFEIYDKEVDRLLKEDASSSLNPLNEHQNLAFNQIKEEFISKDVVLLHGITSSGKTEIYIKLIEEILSQGKQVLYLLPEIALTTQIISRLKKKFGEHVGVYHSKYNDSERVEVWKNILADRKKTNKSFSIVIGARSALFLPFSNLGLVIVDEEHDTSFKQYDPAPRYNARDAAIVLAQIHQSKTLLGSATPSIESFYNTQINKYGLVSLTQRHGGVEMPEILIADVKEETRKKLMKGHFSTLLIENIKSALDRKEQVILFQNRRGFAPMLECSVCAWTPMCKNCDVSLTYHKQFNQLRCHYCGYSSALFSACQACGSTDIKIKGFGTEKIEDDLSVLFPKARIARMDLDTTRSKYAHQTIIQKFEEHHVDVLVGTQMITKGLDFDNVGVVGILNADTMLHFPDFRSFERSFQLMTQVSGRAGRKSTRGKVIIQTHNKSHSIIQKVITNDYKGMYESQIEERKKFNYPPFFRLIKLTFKHKDYKILNNGADTIVNMLKNRMNNITILGPETPVISRIKNQFLKEALIKVDRNKSLPEIKNAISETISKIKITENYKSIRVVVDVDPV